MSDGAQPHEIRAPRSEIADLSTEIGKLPVVLEHGWSRLYWVHAAAILEDAAVHVTAVAQVSDQIRHWNDWRRNDK